MNQEKRNLLAKTIQKSVIADKRPYRLIAEKIGETEDTVIEQIKSWKENRELREISAVMEGEYLSHESALVCARVNTDELEKTADIISAHPMVTHNYERNHEFNLWFTVASPEAFGVEKELEILSKLTGIKKFHPLKKKEVFKIGVVMDLETQKNISEKTEIKSDIEKLEINEKNINLIRAVQKNLPAEKNAFEILAGENGCEEDDLIEFISRNTGKCIRKYIGTFMHRKLGIRSNGMIVWNVAPENASETGNLIASFADVSHCYSRESFEEFPYTLYSMLHGPSPEYIRETAQKIAEKINCKDYLILESTREFKKTRLRYFLPEYDEWIKKHAG
ncbi:MAG: hypothetical protein OEZ13_00845 [Spirochaetia bacterium]|nr:hypothetical protein [Spirochaetia bacterium]